MNIDNMTDSRFLKKEDCDPPIRPIIDHVEKTNVAKMGEELELKYCLFFRNGIKPMVLNSTNRHLIAQALGSKETDDWSGKVIELYFDRTVTFNGRLEGGIRARRATQKLRPVADPA
jgi:hypothetical protein